jgi:hypothetical protein
VEAWEIDSVPMPTDENVEPPVMAKVTLALLPVLVMVRVPVERIGVMVTGHRTVTGSNRGQ